ncbi:muscleblind-like protein 2a isoform X3 [Amphiura filiformis]|uniref:muscleblind-like protein 2a isoform X3 n=1 Tax=Amphiura filiformis TaxID=82378 RepID=UPI003B22294E
MAVVRDTQWLMLEACREYQRGTCKRTDTECKYAHPSKSVPVENGRVTACFDSLKGRCTRENCKYLHPPPHLKTQLEINGRNNLAAQKMLQNIQSQQLMHTAAAAAAMQQLPGVLPPQSLPSAVAQTAVPTIPQVSTANQASTDAVYFYPSMQLPLGAHYEDWSKMLYRTTDLQNLQNPVLQMHHMAAGVPTVPTADAEWPGSNVSKLIYRTEQQTPSPVPNSLQHAYPYLTQLPGGGGTNQALIQEMNLQQQMMPAHGNAMPILAATKNKNDKLEVCREFQRGNCSRGEQECKFAHPNEQTTIDNTDNTVTVCMDYIKGRCTREKCKYFHPPPHLQAKIKAAQHQANQASVAAVLPTTPPENSLKRQRDPADDILLFPGFVPPTKKPPGSLNSPTTIHNHHIHNTPGIYHQLQMQLSNAAHHQPQYIPNPGYQKILMGGPPNSYTWPQGKLGGSFLCQGDMISPIAIPMMQTMPGTQPLYTHQLVPSQQSADTIPVCRDFKSGSCKRPNCKYAHVTEDQLEVIDGKVTMCRDAAKGKCARANCKYYHTPSSSSPTPTPATTM